MCCTDEGTILGRHPGADPAVPRCGCTGWVSGPSLGRSHTPHHRRDMSAKDAQEENQDEFDLELDIGDPPNAQLQALVEILTDCNNNHVVTVYDNWIEVDRRFRVELFPPKHCFSKVTNRVTCYPGDTPWRYGVAGPHGAEVLDAVDDVVAKMVPKLRMPPLADLRLG
jgi:hypothetical protein